MRRPNHQRQKIYDSNCQGYRVRGTAQQIEQKYLTLARESDDKILAEGFKQHAEHYNRIGAEQYGTQV